MIISSTLQPEILNFLFLLPLQPLLFLFFRVKLAIIGGISKPFTSLRGRKKSAYFFLIVKYMYEKERKCAFLALHFLSSTFMDGQAILLPFPRLFRHCIIQCLIVRDYIINVTILADGCKMLAGTRYLASLDATYV